MHRAAILAQYFSLGACFCLISQRKDLACVWPSFLETSSALRGMWQVAAPVTSQAVWEVSKQFAPYL